MVLWRKLFSISRTPWMAPTYHLRTTALMQHRVMLSGEVGVMWELLGELVNRHRHMCPGEHLHVSRFFQYAGTERTSFLRVREHSTQFVSLYLLYCISCKESTNRHSKWHIIRLHVMGTTIVLLCEGLKHSSYLLPTNPEGFDNREQEIKHWFSGPRSTTNNIIIRDRFALFTHTPRIITNCANNYGCS